MADLRDGLQALLCLILIGATLELVFKVDTLGPAQEFLQKVNRDVSSQP